MSKERKAICKHICEAWETFVECGALKELEDEYGTMTEEQRKCFEAGWKIGFDCCLLEAQSAVEELGTSNIMEVMEQYLHDREWRGE